MNFDVVANQASLKQKNNKAIKKKCSIFLCCIYQQYFLKLINFNIHNILMIFISKLFMIPRMNIQLLKPDPHSVKECVNIITLFSFLINFSPYKFLVNNFTSFKYINSMLESNNQCLFINSTNSTRQLNMFLFSLSKKDDTQFRESAIFILLKNI